MSEQEYTLRAEISGLDHEKDIDVKVVNGALTISGIPIHRVASRHALTAQTGAVRRV